MSNALRWSRKARELSARADELQGMADRAPLEKAYELQKQVSELRRLAREEEKAARIVVILELMPFRKRENENARGPSKLTDKRRALLTQIAKENPEGKPQRITAVLFKESAGEELWDVREEKRYDTIYQFVRRELPKIRG